MRTDLVLSPFGADVAALVTCARIADDGGFDGVWTFDHFSGVVAGADWSRDPFVTLGAIAAVTDRVTLGVLVANMANRHAAQLASAVNTLQGLAADRVLAGIVDPSHDRPPIIVGASGYGTIRAAAEHSDGVNIRAGADLAEKVAAARDCAPGPDFEISVFDRLDLAHPLGGDPARYQQIGIDRRTLVMDPPYDLGRLMAISRQLQDEPW